MKYQYKCIKEDGSLETGVLEAEAKDIAVVQLQQMNRRPISVEVVAPKLWPTRAKLEKKEQYRLISQMGIMMELGMDGASAVEILVQSEAEGSKRHKLLTCVSKQLISGTTLADAFRNTDLLDRPYLHWMKLGEAIGKEGESLKGIQRLLGEKLDFRSKVVKAVMYPILLAIFLFAAIIMISKFVFPMFAQLMYDIPVRLWPLPTRVMLWMSHHVLSLIIILVFIFITIWCLISYSYRSKSGENWHEWISKYAPWKNSLQMKREVELLEILTLMQQNAIPLQQALSFVAEHTYNPYVKERLHTALNDMTSGISVSTALEHTGLYSPYFSAFMKKGERGKVLAESMQEFYMIRKAQRKDILERKLKLVEPISIVLVGSMVAFVMLGTLLHVFEMSQYLL